MRGVKALRGRTAVPGTYQTNAALIRSWLNSQPWDVTLLGNLDLLGSELLAVLLEDPCIVQSHVGCAHAPFHPVPGRKAIGTGWWERLRQCSRH